MGTQILLNCTFTFIEIHHLITTKERLIDIQVISSVKFPSNKSRDDVSDSKLKLVSIHLIFVAWWYGKLNYRVKKFYKKVIWLSKWWPQREREGWAQRLLTETELDPGGRSPCRGSVRPASERSWPSWGCRGRPPWPWTWTSVSRLHRVLNHKAQRKLQTFEEKSCLAPLLWRYQID